MSDFVVCRSGEKLTPEQASILKLFGIKTTKFKLTLKAHWSKNDGFKILN